MEKEIEENLITILNELLEKMDFPSAVEIDKGESDILLVRIESEEASLLIGQGGVNLAALQHLARAIVNKKLTSPVNFTIDINNYRSHRLVLFEEMARDLAKQVVQENLSMAMEPMSAYERRAVHMALKDFEGVKTESQGEGAERRVIIKPAKE